MIETNAWQDRIDTQKATSA